MLKLILHGDREELILEMAAMHNLGNLDMPYRRIFQRRRCTMRLMFRRVEEAAADNVHYLDGLCVIFSWGCADE
jgi:hypothetical protein